MAGQNQRKYILERSSIMETQYYKITNINGDYAFLTRIDINSRDEVMVALALLPYDIDIGTTLKWENFTYTTYDK